MCYYFKTGKYIHPDLTETVWALFVSLVEYAAKISFDFMFQVLAATVRIKEKILL